MEESAGLPDEVVVVQPPSLPKPHLVGDRCLVPGGQQACHEFVVVVPATLRVVERGFECVAVPVVDPELTALTLAPPVFGQNNLSRDAEYPSVRLHDACGKSMKIGHRDALSPSGAHDPADRGSRGCPSPCSRRISDGGIEMFRPYTVAIERYRFRGTRIPTPWSSAATPGSPAPAV
jgi:hypothetical protein